jgi:hypothetical protein
MENNRPEGHIKEKTMSKALAKVEGETSFMILADAANAIEALRSNLEGEVLSPMDLDRVTVPAGGTTTWVIPTLDGEENAQEVVGVIVAVQNCRAYWASEFGGAGTPPDCVSEDAVTGQGDPGGVCRVCPMAEFGSDSRGKGQACKMIKRLFLLRPSSMLPLVVNLPPTSLRPATRYLLRLAGAGLKYQGAVTRITLAKTKNSDGIAYAVAEFALAGKLDPGQAQAMEEYTKSIGPLLRRSMTAADYPITD